MSTEKNKQTDDGFLPIPEMTAKDFTFSPYIRENWQGEVLGVAHNRYGFAVIKDGDGDLLLVKKLPEPTDSLPFTPSIMAPVETLEEAQDLAFLQWLWEEKELRLPAEDVYMMLNSQNYMLMALLSIITIPDAWLAASKEYDRVAPRTIRKYNFNAHKTGMPIEDIFTSETQSSFRLELANIVEEAQTKIADVEKRARQAAQERKNRN